MGDLVTVDVIDRPVEGALRGLRALHRLRAPAGCRGLVPCATGELVASTRPAPRPRRSAVMATREDEEALERRTSPCSASRSAAASRDHASGTGAHAEAMRRDRAEERHVAERHLRLRVTAGAGTRDGRSLVAGLAPAPGFGVAA